MSEMQIVASVIIGLALLGATAAMTLALLIVASRDRDGDRD